jgi:hypothetical protein
VDVPAGDRLSTPRPTAIALGATLAATAFAVAAFLSGDRQSPRACLAFLTALFAVRVVGQFAAVARAPSWLPPTEEWNLLPYRLLVPLQIALLVLMGALTTGTFAAGPGAHGALAVVALLYWAAMAIRYAVRMTRRPEARWLGGAIPIVFHCVLAAFLLVLATANA